MRGASIAAKIHLYKVTVIPILDYCCCIWDSYFTTQIDVLEFVQHLAFKIIANNWSYSISTLTSLPFLTEFPTLTTYFQVLAFQHVLTGLSPIPSSSFLFRPPTITRFTDDHKLIVPFAATLSHQQSFFVRGTTLWNAQPTDVASRFSSKNFKMILQNHF